MHYLEPDGPEDVLLTELAGSPDMWARVRAAHHPDTPAHVLVLLAADPERHVRGTVAVNPRAPAVALDILAADPDDAIACDVARHPNTSPATLTRLANHPDSATRAYTASHHAVPLDVLARLMLDPDETVWQHVLMNRRAAALPEELVVEGYLLHNPPPVQNGFARPAPIRGSVETGKTAAATVHDDQCENLRGYPSFPCDCEERASAAGTGD